MIRTLDPQLGRLTIEDSRSPPPAIASRPSEEPSVHAWERIWSRLTVEERKLGAYEYIVQSEKIPAAVDAYASFLAKEAKTRPSVVVGWSLEKRADRLSRAGAIEPDFLGAMITAWLVKRRGPLLARFLDVAEIPNVNGVVDVRTTHQSVPTDRLVAAIRAIEAEFPSRDVGLYVDAIEAQGAVAWQNFAQARRLARKTTPPDTPSASPIPANGVAVGEGPAPSRSPTPRSLPPKVASISPDRIASDPGDPYLADTEGLTALDDLLTDAIVATASHVTGALTFDRLRAVVEETTRLNATRHRSSFHLGFLDVVEGREADPDSTQSSERVRGWYLAGAIKAFARRGDNVGIAALLDRYPFDVRRLLGDRHEACGEAVGLLFDALCATGRRPDALSALVPTAVCKGREAFFERLLSEAMGLLAASRAADASPIVALLTDAIEAQWRRDSRPRAGLAEEVAILRALALRLHGGFDRAAVILAPIATSGDPTLASQARSDLGLVACRVRSLTEIRLPESAADQPSTARLLAPGRGDFEHGSIAQNPHRAQADYALGVSFLASGDVDAARAPLERAVSSLLGGDAVAEGHGVLPRARLYLGLALAESLDVGRAEEALDHVVAGAGSIRNEVPVYVLSRVLTALAAMRAELGARAVVALYDVVGERLLDAASGSGLLAAHEALREALGVRMEDPRRNRRVRSDDAVALLRDSLACFDIPRATRALSALEELADDTEGRARLLALLEHRTNYDPAWDIVEATDARVRLLEAGGRYADAAVLLAATAHETLSKDGERGLAITDGVLDRIDAYGIELPDAGLSARVEALRRPSIPDAPRTRRPVGRVYFVGGNEVQARYEAWLRAEAAILWPDVALDFDFTGWSSNWGRSIPMIEARIADARAVVIMRFIRTMLGRTVRDLCGRHGRPWVACTGHGRESLLGAIGRAVALLPDAQT